MKIQTFFYTILLFASIQLTSCGTKDPGQAASVEEAEKILEKKRAKEAKENAKAMKQAKKAYWKRQSKAAKKSVKKNLKRQKKAARQRKG